MIDCFAIHRSFFSFLVYFDTPLPSTRGRCSGSKARNHRTRPTRTTRTPLETNSFTHISPQAPPHQPQPPPQPPPPPSTSAETAPTPVLPVPRRLGPSQSGSRSAAVRETTRLQLLREKVKKTKQNLHAWSICSFCDVFCYFLLLPSAE